MLLAALRALAASIGDLNGDGKADVLLRHTDGSWHYQAMDGRRVRDAADQCSLSRIWGGIHPPVDDIPGRLIGIEVGCDAFALAEAHFAGTVR